MPRRLGLVLGGLSAVGLAAAWALKGHDHRETRWAWAALAAKTVQPPALFGPAVVADLPEPALRYFTFAITPGTPLRILVELDMVGEIGLGDKERPNYQPMVAPAFSLPHPQLRSPSFSLVSAPTVVLNLVFVILNRKNVSGGASVERQNALMRREGAMLGAMNAAMV